jgi:uncharacterized phage protein (TIGR01671 family)
MRATKYKAWLPSDKFMGVPFDLAEELTSGGSCDWPSDTIFLQSTGHSDQKDVEIFEGDILRETIELEEGDVNHYFIVTWISEWCLLAALLHTEYEKYVKYGADSLDESMFWTFTIERGNQFAVCGNIHQHPNYIQNALVEEGKSFDEL